MATGFMQRFKGKIKAHVLYLGTGGMVLNAKGVDVPAASVWTKAGAPTNGAAGTYFGTALPGDLLVDTTNKVLYQNTNTSASPTWTALTTATGAGTYTGTFDGIVGGTTPAAATVTALIATTAKVDTGTKTASATAGAATLNKGAGRITSEALTTAGLADYTLTLTNSAIAAADQVMVNVGNGTNTQGDAVVGTVTPAAGSVVVVIRNAHATQALNGTLIVNFVVFKA